MSSEHESTRIPISMLSNVILGTVRISEKAQGAKRLEQELQLLAKLVKQQLTELRVSKLFSVM